MVGEIQFVGESTFGRGEYSLKVRVQLVGESTVGRSEDS